MEERRRRRRKRRRKRCRRERAHQRKQQRSLCRCRSRRKFQHRRDHRARGSSSWWPRCRLRVLPRGRGPGARETAERCGWRHRLSRRGVFRLPWQREQWKRLLFFDQQVFSSGCCLRPLCGVGRASRGHHRRLGGEGCPRPGQRAALLALEAAAAVAVGGGGRRRLRRSFFPFFRRRPAAGAVRGRPGGDASGALPAEPFSCFAFAFAEGEAAEEGGRGRSDDNKNSNRCLASRRARGRRRGSRRHASQGPPRGGDLRRGPDGAGHGE